MAKMSVDAETLKAAASSYLSGDASTIESTAKSLSSTLSSVSDTDGFGLSSAASTLGSNITNKSEDIKTVLTNVQNYAAGAIDIDGESGAQEVDYATLFNSDGSIEGNAKVVWNFLKAKGLSDEAAAGVMGNIQAESNFKTTALGDNGTSYGLIQWHNSRWDNLKSFCSEHGYDSSSLQGQLEFLWYESLDPSRGYGKTLASKGFYNASAVDAAVIFHDVVEKSASSPDTVRNKRGGYASQWYDKFKGTSAGIDLSNVGATTSLGATSAVADPIGDTGGNSSGGGGGGSGYYGTGGGGGSGGYSSGSGAAFTPTSQFLAPTVGEFVSASDIDFTKLEEYLQKINGKTITIPAGLGKVHSYMGWQMITAKSSNQYKLRQAAGMNFDKDGFGMIGDRYVVATTTTFGQVGDFIDVTQEDGTVIKCIIGDIKNQNDAGCNQWGHNDGKCVVEFVVDKTSWYGSNKTVVGIHPEFNQNIKSITNKGNYFTLAESYKKNTPVAV